MTVDIVVSLWLWVAALAGIVVGVFLLFVAARCIRTLIDEIMP